MVPGIACVESRTVGTRNALNCKESRVTYIDVDRFRMGVVNFCNLIISSLQENSGALISNMRVFQGEN